jgi:hypothetical protein
VLACVPSVQGHCKWSAGGAHSGRLVPLVAAAAADSTETNREPRATTMTTSCSNGAFGGGQPKQINGGRLSAPVRPDASNEADLFGRAPAGCPSRAGPPFVGRDAKRPIYTGLVVAANRAARESGRPIWRQPSDARWRPPSETVTAEQHFWPGACATWRRHCCRPDCAANRKQRRAAAAAAGNT